MLPYRSCHDMLLQDEMEKRNRRVLSFQLSESCSLAVAFRFCGIYITFHAGETLGNVSAVCLRQLVHDDDTRGDN